MSTNCPSPPTAGIQAPPVNRRIQGARGIQAKLRSHPRRYYDAMSPIPARYNTGYNVGVGGAVVEGDRVLLVRRATDHGRGTWQIPGGFCEPDETLPEAAVREVQEEAGLTTEVQGLLAVRSRHGEDHSTYVVFLLRRVVASRPPAKRSTPPDSSPWRRSTRWTRFPKSTAPSRREPSAPRANCSNAPPSSRRFRGLTTFFWASRG